MEIEKNSSQSVVFTEELSIDRLRKKNSPESRSVSHTSIAVFNIGEFDMISGRDGNIDSLGDWKIWEGEMQIFSAFSCLVSFFTHGQTRPFLWGVARSGPRIGR